jgi:hypothetical protein
LQQGTSRRQFAGQLVRLGLLGATPLLDMACGGGGGAVRVSEPGKTLALANNLIRAEWNLTSQGLWTQRVQDLRSGQVIQGPQPAFTVKLTDGITISSANMHVVGAAREKTLVPNPQASRLAERLAGRQIAAAFEDSQGRVRVAWRAILLEGSHYIRQEVTLQAIGGSLPLGEIRLLDFELSGAQVSGRVRGSPVTAGGCFLGFEHPLSTSHVIGSRLQCSLLRRLPLNSGDTVTYSSVIGVSGEGQLRRDFLRYLEYERACPYRTFLHYNSWYDIAYGNPYNETDALDVIAAFSRELYEKRKVVLDSFLFDDGWDNHNSVWDFNSGFPEGFARLKEAAALCHAAPGAWLSPWGGYGEAREERLAFGIAQGYETDADGFALSGPRYFQRFEQVCMDMIGLYGVNHFKFDGTGDAFSLAPGCRFDSDLDAALGLITDLRARRPDLYVNLTTGTYPSPFWLRWADSTWRGGYDHDFTGDGSDRQQWITYRDAATFQNIVQPAPLYPLNSLMLHGLIFAKQAGRLSADPDGDFDAEIRSYFGTGTQLQEMYITHSLLLPENWDSLAEAANWSRRNAPTLADTHWVGGDPEQLQVYGWAAWSPQKGIITLRNPSAQPQDFALDIGTAFELPPGAAQQCTARSPWLKDVALPPVTLEAGNAQTLELEPFEVRTLEASF